MFFSRKNKGDPANVLLLYHGVEGQGMASFKAFPGPFWALSRPAPHISPLFIKKPSLPKLSSRKRRQGYFIIIRENLIILSVTKFIMHCKKHGPQQRKQSTITSTMSRVSTSHSQTRI